MARRIVAEARRSQLVSTFGVGALFPAQDESFMIVGLDDWPEDWRTPIVSEPRLARSLGVLTFRQPPSGSTKGQDLPVIRFPRMHHCPGCHRLGTLNKFGSWDDNKHEACQRRLTPSRFVICCRKGHIDDFPYFGWVHRGEPTVGDKHDLSLRTRGKSSSLADIVVSCSCGVSPRSMAGSFSPQALLGIKNCSGDRPWLRGAGPQECDGLPRTLQRGASNVWFSIQRSALSIPPWSEGVMNVIGKYWPMLEHVPADALAAVLTGMQIPQTTGLSAESLMDAILEMRGEKSEEIPTEEELRAEEYQALVVGRPETDPRQQFVCTPVDGLHPHAKQLLAGVSEVARLREVRALTGFHRLLPGDDSSSGDAMAELSLGNKVRWLPAVEVLGEGVFIRLREDALLQWEGGEFARSRATAINAAYEMRARQFGADHAPTITPRELLIHSFAHVVLTELSLDAGYPTASLRERVFAGPGQSGVLIYTASADSAGSLGGLSAQADPDRIWGVITSAIARSQWCSSDPVCIESQCNGVDGLNLAACHACLLLPETSCEQMNHVLDRATLVGIPGAPSAGFFSAIGGAS